MAGQARSQRTDATKTRDETDSGSTARLEIGLVCDAGSSSTGIHGMTDLFSYAGEAARRQSGRAQSPVRVVHWRAAESGDIECVFDSSPGHPHRPSVLVIPGNRHAVSRPATSGPLTEWLRQAHARGVVIAAVCGGVFVLAETGLVTGRQVTTHWALRDQFEKQFPDVLTETDRMVIDYGDVVTGGGVLAWTDLGLGLTERFLGPSVMVETARYMNVDPPGREQRFYSDFDPRTKHGDEAILRSQRWLTTQRGQPVSVASIAAQACLEPRTFLRRFVKATGMKPTEYQQRLRMSRAREMLEFSRDSVSQVASRIGYEDVAGFRRVFRKIMGLTPSDYRRRFNRLSNAKQSVST